MNIPVFHDDQHGTAIIVAAAVRNGLLLQGKELADVQAGHLRRRRRGARLRRPAGRAWACEPENVTLTDIKGVVYAGPRRRTWRPTWRATPATTEARTLADVLPGADVFLGLSAPRRAEAGMAAAAGRRSRSSWRWPTRTRRSLPELARAAPARRDHRHRALATIRTRSTTSSASRSSSAARSMSARPTINEAMKLAAVEAIAELARIEASEVGGRGLWRRMRRCSAPTTSSPSRSIRG